MNRKDLLYSLNLNDQTFVYDEIHSVAAIEFYPLVRNWKSDLSFERQALHGQFMAQTFLVGRLQQSWSKDSVYFDRRTQNALGQGVSLCLCASVSLWFITEPTCC